MIGLIDIPTERTTAATDLVLAIQTGAMTIALALNPSLHVFRGWLWIGVFGGMFLTAGLGTVAHGFMMTRRTNTILWQILTFCFSVCYVLIISSIVHDLLGPEAGRVALAACSLLGLALVAFCIGFPAFVPRIIYIGVGLGACILGASAWLAFVARTPGSLPMLAGMLLASVATLVEARKRFRLRLVWEFDHHSGYHFLQFLANFCLYLATTTYFGT